MVNFMIYILYNCKFLKMFIKQFFCESCVKINKYKFFVGVYIVIQIFYVVVRRVKVIQIREYKYLDKIWRVSWIFILFNRVKVSVFWNVRRVVVYSVI